MQVLHRPEDAELTLVTWYRFITWDRCRSTRCVVRNYPELKEMRRKLRTREGRRVSERRKALVEPVFGVLKQQRNLRQFRTRGQARVAAEFTLAALAYNLTRMFHRRLQL